MEIMQCLLLFKQFDWDSLIKILWNFLFEKKEEWKKIFKEFN